jgi:hypothetical protein
MPGGDEGNKGPDEEKIRWLLAAVLHHEPDEGDEADGGEDR